MIIINMNLFFLGVVVVVATIAASSNISDNNYRCSNVWMCDNSSSNINSSNSRDRSTSK